ncbi:MAG: M50 family metallopeptidase [Deltaproteobacteria bacterium]
MDPVSVSLAIVAVGLLIIIHESGHYFAAKWSGMNVSRFSIGFGPIIAKVTRNETTFTICAIPFGGFVQIDGMNPEDGTDPDAPTSYLRRPFHQRFATILAGPAANYLLGFTLWFGLLVAFNYEPLPPIEVTAVSADSPAETAGLKKGDLLTGVAGKPFETVEDFLKAIDDSGGAAIAFDVRRESETKVVTVTPQKVGEGWRVGVGFAPTEKKAAPLSVGDALAKSWSRTVEWTKSPFKMIAGMIDGVFGIDDVSGPIGIVKTMGGAFERSWIDALSFAAAISIALGIFNLLPIPALDGSRLLFLLVGLIRRRPVDSRVEAWVHGGGFVLLAALIVVVSVFDVLR